ncbi:MAG: hypothetical protein J6127_00650 [Clostridiales bacterium]|nr:hypothetical protein [Clostridiales bacterium]
MRNKILSLIIAGSVLVSAAGCNKTSDNMVPGIGDSPLTPVGNYLNGVDAGYTDEGIIEEAVATYVSDDGLCTISVMPDYYDVTLDYENGSRYDVGASYGRTIPQTMPSYESVMEPYLYGNIRTLFGGYYTAEAVEDRVYTLYASMREEYREEIDGLASSLSQGRHGFVEDELLSYEEVLALQMIPDVLRPTACSALTLWGERTETGEMLTLRNLEWGLGENYQMGLFNAVTHMQNGERSITAIALLGMLDIISAVNDDGVFAAILDVGSEEHEQFIYEGRKCYTMELRYALEEFTTARQVGEFMVGESAEFTWCHNLTITDGNEAFCAEDCVLQVEQAGDGYSILRDASTPLLEGLSWDNSDSLCIVNSFASEGNQDGFTGVPSNTVRFAKYNEWVSEIGVFSVTDLKNMITQETVEQYDVENVHSNGTSQLIIIDYATGSIQVAFTGSEGPVDNPLFVEVGNIGVN